MNNALWEKLLDLKSRSTRKNCLGWSFDGISFDEILSPSDLDKDLTGVLIKSNEVIYENIELLHFKQLKIPFEELFLFVNTSIANDLLEALQNYWPLSILSHINADLPHIFIHAAISLDGYLATTSGHSKWIGNDENLVHAHRLRALTDAVLVGGKTVLNDKPSLNVRHVKGKNPIRLILSNRCDDLSSLKKVSDCKTYLLRDIEYTYNDSTNDFDKIIFFSGESKNDKILDLLEKCKKEKIASILIEGGGTTLSAFIETKFAKIVQFHLSPMLFGDGIKAVKLPKVNLVDETHKLKNMSVTQVGDTFMITAGLV